MGDRNLTLFAIHTHGDTQFGPSSVPGVGSDDAESSSDDASTGKSWFGKGSDETNEDEKVPVADEESGGGGLGALLIALVVLAGIAMVVKKLTGSDDSVDLAESDDL
ncbi:hypothetical protein [Salinarchaeum laminariae]|uniref:hypothetical protein n=1 Tax=Salinarchaeum laminariae TaxID=869888 RepID=UPI0020BE6DF3|nr:hypothetical protein [Salinarchaeum laminariae]